MLPNSDPVIDQVFPNALTEGYTITSPMTVAYNCIAWAAGVDTRWWWPDALNLYYWPPQVQRAETVPAFIEAYALLGYEICADNTLEAGYEKVAIYTDPQNIPTHASRQLPSGEWTSKIGPRYDISHTWNGLDSQSYGVPHTILRRPVV